MVQRLRNFHSMHPFVRSSEGLSELDVMARIMRQENYMIALLSRPDVLDLRVPLPVRVRACAWAGAGAGADAQPVGRSWACCSGSVATASTRTRGRAGS